MKRRVICMLLALCSLLCACAKYTGEPGTGQAPTSRPSAPIALKATPIPTTTPKPITAWADMIFTDIDKESFLAKAQRMTELAEGEDAEALCRQYDEMYRQYVWDYTMTVLAGIHNNLDVTDELWATRKQESDAALTQELDAFAAACGAAVQGACAQAFTEHIGEENAAAFGGYTPMSEREMTLLNRRSELEADYYAAIAQQETLKTVYAGREWTFPMLYGAEGAAVSAEEYWHIFTLLQEQLTQLIVPIYQDLVLTCDELARLRGYEDFNHYVYEREYGRDYTPESARTLFSDIKQVLAQTSYDPQNSPLQNRQDEVTPQYTQPAAMIDALGSLTCDLDSLFAEQWDYLVRNGLYDIRTGTARSDSTATFDLPAFDHAQFIAFNPDDYSASQNMTRLVHEFGHFTALRTVPDPNYLTSFYNMDLSEIHATALELLTLRNYDAIYTQGADIARFIALSDVWGTIRCNAMYAEFEMDVFENPQMRAEEMNLLYGRLLEEYGYGKDAVDSAWIYVPHFFFGPGYVISYVAAGLASLQVWDAAQENFDEGLKTYLDIVYAGCYNRNYAEVLESVGLQSFSVPGIAGTVARDALHEMQILESEILTDQAPAA